MHEWQKGVVTRLKQNTEVTWKDIGYAVDEKPETVRQFWYRQRLNAGLPPKDVLVKNAKITGTICVKLKKKQIEEPKISFKELNPPFSA